MHCWSYSGPVFSFLWQLDKISFLSVEYVVLLQLPKSSRRGGVAVSTVLSMSALSAPQGMLSCLAALPCFSCLITLLMSSLVSLPLSISRSSSAGKMSSGFCRAGLLSNTPKCSTYLVLCCSSPTTSLPALSFWSYLIPEFSRNLLGGVIETFHISYFCCLFSCFS